MRSFGIGQPVSRKEDPRFLTGRGRYVADLDLPRQGYAVFLFSPHAHARIRSIAIAAALVVAPFDAPGCLGRIGSRRSDPAFDIAWTGAAARSVDGCGCSRRNASRAYDRCSPTEAK